MTRINCISRLKVLVALQKNEEGAGLQQALECLGHRVQLCADLNGALRWLHEWQPDLLVADEAFEWKKPDSGLRLAEYCRHTKDQVNGWCGTRTMIFIPVPDWDRFKRAQRTGAHVIVKGTNLEAAIRYIQTIADSLVTERMLGPALVAMHSFRGDSPHPRCADCEWAGASISYGSSQTDLQQLTPVRTALLNVLLFRRRGQSPNAIVSVCHECRLLKKILRGHVFRESAIKMEITRLRRDIGYALEDIGAPYGGEHFLPLVPRGMKAYLLAGNRRLIHLPADNSVLAVREECGERL